MAAGIRLETTEVFKKVVTGVPSILASWLSCATLKDPAGFLSVSDKMGVVC